MSNLKIDYDRGVMKRKHAASGVDVYMYVDAPGLYLTAHGTYVSDKFAEQAGYDVKNLALARVKKERVSQALAAIDTELAMAGPKHETVKEKGGLKVVDTGVGRFNVEDTDGNILNNVSLSKEMALKLLDNLIPEEAAKASPASATA